MSKSDYPDYPPQRSRKHRVMVGDATFTVTSNVNGNTRWIREVHHVRRHRKGGSAEVCIYPDGGRKPSATLASLWAHLGVDPGARWKECAADHPAFPAKRSIRTAMDTAGDARRDAAATAVLVAAGWTWVQEDAGHWEAPPAQALDLERFRGTVKSQYSMTEWMHRCGFVSAEKLEESKKNHDHLMALIDSKADGNG
ncbi:hypothetical protein PAERUG_E15_London_28_01_14_04150 [Pseudomonas aeruginosa]|nr:hypothetical protein PAERUG_E15_London_28_01_14_04150 [Pseudomonas aeruginosa]